jgi:hypothetical protein
MKTITVPKNAEAERFLDLNKCPPDQLEEIALTQEQFDKLWSAGLFAEINKICGSLIDDYEDGSISTMNSISAVLELIQSKQWSEEVTDSVTKIEGLLEKAKEQNTSVHFYF